MVGGRCLSCHTTYLLTLSYKGRAVQILSTCYVPYHGGNDATFPTLRTIPNRARRFKKGFEGFWVRTLQTVRGGVFVLYRCVHCVHV